MKFKVGDTVRITGGKDKGKQSTIVRVVPREDKVVVKDINLYTRHVKPQGGRAGEKVRRERPLPVANIAILNADGKVDRIAYQEKDGAKVRVFKKSGTAVPEPKAA